MNGRVPADGWRAGLLSLSPGGGEQPPAPTPAALHLHKCPPGPLSPPARPAAFPATSSAPTRPSHKTPSCSWALGPLRLLAPADTPEGRSRPGRSPGPFYPGRPRSPHQGRTQLPRCAGPPKDHCCDVDYSHSAPWPPPPSLMFASAGRKGTRRLCPRGARQPRTGQPWTGQAGDRRLVQILALQRGLGARHYSGRGEGPRRHPASGRLWAPLLTRKVVTAVTRVGPRLGVQPANAGSPGKRPGSSQPANPSGGRLGCEDRSPPTPPPRSPSCLSSFPCACDGAVQEDAGGTPLMHIWRKQGSCPAPPQESPPPPQ